MGKKILLADDSLTIQKVVELTLAGTDYELTCVSNGQKALETLRHLRPDLILADVVMPEKNGYEVCEAVKADPDTSGIPVLLLSGTFEPFDRDRADHVRADRVVSKPFDAPHLLDEIDSLLSPDSGAAPRDSSSTRRRHDEASFLDDTIPTGAATRGSDDFELEVLTESFVPQAEEAPRPASGNASGDSRAAGAEPAPSEGFAGGPVFLAASESPSGREETPDRLSVEEAAPESSPSASAGEGPGIEEISAEEAAAFFDGPAGPVPQAPVSPPLVSDLTEEQIERIAALVVAKLSDRVLREIVWEVVPEVAETVVKRRIEELESGVE